VYAINVGFIYYCISVSFYQSFDGDDDFKRRSGLERRAVYLGHHKKWRKKQKMATIVILTLSRCELLF